MTDPFYIVYDNEDQALLRSEQGGAMRGLSWSLNGTGSRYWFAVEVESKEDNPRAAIVLPTTTENEINEETGEVVNSRVVPVDLDILTSDDLIQMVEQLPSDWVHPPELEEIVQPD
tara:strand:+ start:627 stop:974 length:348 start_codon:yes stop_codon:yes gene_type:complete